MTKEEMLLAIYDKMADKTLSDGCYFLWRYWLFESQVMFDSRSKTNIRNLKDMFPPEIKKIFSDIEEIDPSIVSQLKELYSLTRMKFPESSDDDIAKEFIEIIDKMMKEKD